MQPRQGTYAMVAVLECVQTPRPSGVHDRCWDVDASVRNSVSPHLHGTGSA